MKLKNFKKLKGFVLLEISISLLIVSIFLSICFEYVKRRQEQNQKFKTQKNANYIRKAMQGFVAKKGFLPCCAENENGKEKENNFSGFVPYKTLGIPKKYIYDGKNKPFTLYINKDLALSSYKHKKVVPVFIPYSTYPCLNTVTFNRIYKTIPHEDERAANYGYIFYKQNRIVDKYDDIKEQNLKLFHKKQLIVLKSIIIQEQINSHHLMAGDFVSKNSAEESKNLIAWCIISGKHNSEYIETDNPNYMVFWQSRFNLSAQIKTPATIEPADFTRAQHYKFELNKKSNKKKT